MQDCSATHHTLYVRYTPYANVIQEDIVRKIGKTLKIKLDPADLWFSKYIRLRDGECRRCHSPVQFNSKGDPISHQASHFQGRRKEATRFDPENVDCLCTGCHAHFTAFPFEHVQWQMSVKGENTVRAIVIRSNSYIKKDRKMQALIWKQAYLQLKSEKSKH